MTKTKHYPDLSGKVNFPKVEEEVLAFWEKDNTFKKSINNRPTGDNGDNEYVFYDGPPFANGLPHYGHLLTGFIKDVIPRYQTLKGKHVDRRFGWDCHGLPAELDAEKVLGISGKKEILDLGLDKFNQTCRTQVMKYTKEWESSVNRQARWVDFENDYKTMETPYMESIIWAFKSLYDKGLIYEGVKVLPYSWAIETPLSNFETRMDDSYRDRDDPAITVMFKLIPTEEGAKPRNILVWTTTPWTLPSNLALCVGADIDYAIFEENGVEYVIAEALAGNYKKQLENAEKAGSIKGAELVGRNYEPLFDYFKGTENAFKVISGEFVSTEDGTGIVHIAPGFGEDDLQVSRINQIPVVCPVDSKGQFTDEVPDFKGIQVFEANKPIIKLIKDKGQLIKQEMYTHSYPHCWRTGTPLIYKITSSWFVDVPKFKDRMVELNQQINWMPAHIKDGQFGKWLEGAREWCISRNRFFGSPIPVWKSDNPKYPRMDVYGSIEELERDFGVKVDDLHRPFIDSLTRANPDDPTGQSKMVRVDDVLDCWFESGSMSFAQVHYPFENKEWFESHFPADFIVEYVAQTRGWFYSMVVMAVGLFDKIPFKNCMCHGVVLDENNQKLSKSKKNYPSPDQVYNNQGSDALRWHLMASPIIGGGNLSIDREGAEIGKSARKAILPLWNAYYFFCLYANAEGVKAKEITKSDDVLDNYILSKLKVLIDETTIKMDKYDISGACAGIEEFLELLNNWYIRRSRARFWDGQSTSAKAAFDTLYTVLTNVCVIASPLLPLISDYIYQGLTGEKASIHLANWPNSDGLVNDEKLISNMDFVRTVCTTAKSLRENASLRTRLPLKELKLAGKGKDKLASFIDLVKDEVNVKEIAFDENVTELATEFLYIHTPKVGKRLGKALRDIQNASKSGDWKISADGSLDIAGQTLTSDEFELRLQIKDGLDGMALPDNTAVVVLDTKIYPDLEREGIARDFIRAIQERRKTMDLDISDRIEITFASDDNLLLQSFEEYEDYIKEQTLATSLTQGITKSQEGEEIGSGNITFDVKSI